MLRLAAEGSRDAGPSVGNPVSVRNRLGPDGDALQRIDEREPLAAAGERDLDLDRTVHGADRSISAPS